MTARDPFWQDLVEDAADIAGDYLRSGGIRVNVKTNLGPELTVYDGKPKRGGLGSFVRAQVIVRQADGDAIATYGEPAPTEPLKVIALVAAVSLIGLVLIRGVLK